MKALDLFLGAYFFKLNNNIHYISNKNYLRNIELSWKI